MPNRSKLIIELLLYQCTRLVFCKVIMEMESKKKLVQYVKLGVQQVFDFINDLFYILNKR